MEDDVYITDEDSSISDNDFLNEEEIEIFNQTINDIPIFYTKTEKTNKFGCEIIAKCCNKKFKCIECHDEQTDHELKNKDIERVVCCNCGKEQDISGKCQSCEIPFARFYCPLCKLLSNEILYHCEYCDKCSYKKWYKHCNKCGCCLPHNHICIENKLDNDCAICLEKLKNGKKNIVLECGHVLHKMCFNKLIANKCPICNKSTLNMIGTIELQ